MSGREKVSGAHIEDAEALFLTLMGPDATPKDWDRYEHLKRSSAEHRAIFLRCEETWHAVGDLGAARLMEKTGQQASDQATPLTGAASDTNGSNGGVTSNSRGWFGGVRWTLVAAAATVLVIIGLGFRYVSDATPEIVRYATATSEHKQIDLPDGSMLELGGRSTVDVHYTETGRLIELQVGEVLATVAHDENRPFILVTDDVMVMATGTAFNVRNGSEYSTVSVVEGAVRVVPQAAPGNIDDGQSAITAPSRNTFDDGATLREGQQLRSEFDDKLTPVETVDIDLVVSWRSGQLYFPDDDLATVFETATRYSDASFQLTDEILRKETYNGSLRLDRMDAWLEGMERVFSLKISRIGPDWIVVSPAE